MGSNPREISFCLSQKGVPVNRVQVSRVVLAKWPKGTFVSRFACPLAIVSFALLERQFTLTVPHFWHQTVRET